MTLDGFFFNPTPIEAYTLVSEVIPESAIEEASFAGEAGLLYGWWARATSTSSERVVVYYHGNSGNLDDTIPLVEGLWQLGFTVFAVDYRGYGRSEGTPDHDGVIADAVSTANYVAAELGSTTEALVYYGQSLGAFTSSHAALSVPPAGLIMESGFASGELISDQSASLDLPSGWVLKEGYDNTSSVAALHVPVMVMHGVQDDYISVSHGDAIYAAANPEKFYWKLEGSDHAELDLVDPVGWSDHVSCWVELSHGFPDCRDGLEGSSAAAD